MMLPSNQAKTDFHFPASSYIFIWTYHVHQAIVKSIIAFICRF